ncbi:Caspase-1 [Lucilia cuprina]|nr:Caspase-1 [Lucilia cuprina]
MKWFKSSKKEEEEEENNARALVRQDPRTNVKTTTAQSETTNTTTQNSTIFNNNKNTVTYQSTKQTVTSRQTARITEITSRRTPTPEEIEEMMRLLHLNKKPFFSETKTFTTTTTTSSVPVRRNRPGNLPALPSSQRNSQNGISPKSATKFKNTVSPVSRLIFNYESSSQGAGGSAGDASSKTPKTPTIVKTSSTTVTEKNGRTITQRVEEHRIKFDAKNFKLSTPNSPLTKNFTGAEDSYKFDARPMLPALPAPSRLSSSSIGSNNSSTSSIFNKTTISKPTSTYATTYTSPYKQRELNRVPNTTTTFSSSTKPSLTTKTSTTTSTKPNTSSSSLFTNTTTKPNSIFSLSTPKTTATTYTSSISKPTPLFTSSSTTRTPTTTASLKNSTPTLVVSGKTITTPLSKPGYAYIFNNVIFDNPNNEERVGSAEDVKALVQTFEYFKMKTTVIENAKVDKIRKTVEKIQTKDFKENACLVIVILSHGTRHEEIAAKDGHYSIDDHILFPILRNPTLNDKPKLFFIQACKGSMETNGYYTDAVPFSSPHGSANEILKCYSTFEGFVSYRTEKGSMFIQALCQNLKLFGSTKNIKDIMELVTQIVKQQSQNKQIPAYTSTLTKPFIFGDYVKWTK